MYESGVNSEEAVNYNLLFCHACLSSNRTLTSVGYYIDVYLKICDNSRMNLTSQVNVCWECMALLKKVHAFKRKVDNAQKLLDYCVDKQVPLEDNLSDLTLSSTETTTFDYYPIDKEEEFEYENYLDKPNKISEYKHVAEDLYELDELMFKIEDVRGRCDILDVKSVLDLSTISCDLTVKTEPGSPEDEEACHRRWKRSVLLVFKRICSHRYAQHFLRPVSDELAPHYSRIVRRPTDLATIRARIKDGVIRTTADLTHALLLMFSNALMYNSSYHDIYQMALEFREETLRELSLLAAAQTDGAPAPALRRRAAPTVPRPLPLARRRQSVWNASQEDQTKLVEAPRPARASASPRRPRASVSPRSPRASPAADAAAAEPPRRRKWDWPDNDQYLVANCFKKYKSTLLL